MELQYRFSNENHSSLPFDLNSHLSFCINAQQAKAICCAANIEQREKINSQNEISYDHSIC